MVYCFQMIKTNLNKKKKSIFRRLLILEQNNTAIQSCNIKTYNYDALKYLKITYYSSEYKHAFYR